MTVEEVSEYLRLAQSTIYKLLSEGKLPGRKIGGSWRFSRRALDEWIEVDVVRRVDDDRSGVEFQNK
jgi:excisionase family DNA binding protein